jgi:hypothetical protein
MALARAPDLRSTCLSRCHCCQRCQQLLRLAAAVIRCVVNHDGTVGCETGRGRSCATPLTYTHTVIPMDVEADAEAGKCKSKVPGWYFQCAARLTRTPCEMTLPADPPALFLVFCSWSRRSQPIASLRVSLSFPRNRAGPGKRGTKGHIRALIYCVSVPSPWFWCSAS